MAVSRGLGRGLDALFSDNADSSSGAVTLRISQIEPNKNQPRKKFDTAALEELCESIKAHGILQPLVVRPLSTGGYQLVAGERRWRAARMAELTEVPVVIKNLSDAETMEIALIENLQREDLDPIEEALGYQTLMQTLGLTQDEAAKKMGKARTTVTNSLRLLTLSDSIKKMVSNGEISPSGARTLLSLPEEQRAAGAKLLKEGATVRELENLAREAAEKPKTPAKKPQREQFYSESEIYLSNALGRPVKINPKAKGGRLSIEFYSADDLKELLKNLNI